MFHLLVLSQTGSITSHLYRIENIICRNNIGNFDICESVDCCIWDFRNIKNTRVVLLRSSRLIVNENM